MAGACERKGEMRNTYKISVGKPEGKRPIARRRHIWEDVNKQVTLKWISRKCGVRLWTRFFLLRTETSGGLL
jgi:hypothetical protein